MRARADASSTTISAPLLCSVIPSTCSALPSRAKLHAEWGSPA